MCTPQFWGYHQAWFCLITWEEGAQCVPPSFGGTTKPGGDRANIRIETKTLEATAPAKTADLDIAGRHEKCIKVYSGFTPAPKFDNVKLPLYT